MEQKIEYLGRMATFLIILGVAVVFSSVLFDEITMKIMAVFGGVIILLAIVYIDLHHHHKYHHKS